MLNFKSGVNRLNPSPVWKSENSTKNKTCINNIDFVNS